MISLFSPIETVPRIHRSITGPLKRLGIATIRDLLCYPPTRYQDFSDIKLIRDLVPNEIVTVSGIIEKVSSYRPSKARMNVTEAVIRDATGTIKAIWFNQPFLLKNLKEGTPFTLSGKVALGPRGIYLSNPAHEKTNAGKGIHTGGLIAVYPETEGITSRWLRFLIKSFLPLADTFPEPLPDEILQKYGVPRIKEAIFSLHAPETFESADRAKKRFALEQLLLLHLRALKERSRLKQHKAPVIKMDLALLKEFVSSLPFTLTNAQRRSIWEIAQDLSKGKPMNRILEGDVGSGKTVVSAAVSLLAVSSGFRVAFMAPTEILAHQHFDTLRNLLAPFNMPVGLITASKKQAVDSRQIIVGTHALIQKNLHLSNLGLVIIDEQHRFGVEQRAELLLRHESEMLPHFLSMSATPIPRTIALALYGDLDLSLLDEMPQARKKVITQVVYEKNREKIYAFIKSEIKRGGQVFVVCPKIDVQSEQHSYGSKAGQQKLSLRAEVKAVKEEYKKLSEQIFPDYKVAMLHGKMKPREKDETLKRFRDHETHLLIATSVVEVGVDIPNATIMIIEGAERFGLATLHQFRGRVGRGRDQSYCFLFPTEQGMGSRRLEALASAKNGFELAELDLQIRGPGDVFGIKQSGEDEIMRVAFANTKLIKETRHEAITLVKKSPDLALYPELSRALQRMENALHLE